MDDLTEPNAARTSWWRRRYPFCLLRQTEREGERESRWAGLAEKSHTKCKYSTLLFLWFAAVLTVLALSPARREKTISSDDGCRFFFFLLSSVKKTNQFVHRQCYKPVLSKVRLKWFIYSSPWVWKSVLSHPEPPPVAIWSTADVASDERELWCLCALKAAVKICDGCLARTKRRRACNEREAHAVDWRFLLWGEKWSIIQKECCKVVVVQSSTLTTQLTTL